MNDQLKYQRIFKELSDEIAAGKYRESGRLPSESQLVKKYKVSRPTVMRALRDLQSMGVIERKAGAGSFLVDAPTTSFKMRGHHQLALLIPRAGLTEIFEVICGELAGLAKAYDCSLIWEAVGSPVNAQQDISVKEIEHICEEFIEALGQQGFSSRPSSSRPEPRTRASASPSGCGRPAWPSCCSTATFTPTR